MNKKYDILIVGAGLTAATVCALLKDKYSILVIDSRRNIGGNCADFEMNGSYVSSYGPHIFHTNDNNVISFLSNYTKWISYKHTVKAEIIHNNDLKEVHFPLSNKTKDELGYEPEKEEVLNLFFKDYSEKMWDKPFEEISQDIINRIPLDYNKDYSYFKNNKYEMLPKHGYTQMMKNMFKGCNMILNADKNLWKTIKADKIIYTGRIDHILKDKVLLPYRDLNFEFKHEYNHRKDVCSINFCHKETMYTRKTFTDFFYKSDNNIVCYESSHFASKESFSPSYPINTEENRKIYDIIKEDVKKIYPNIFFLGRLGKYKYLDMDQCVKEAIDFCQNIL